MFVQNLALVTETPKIDQTWLSRVAATVQKQVTRDFAPIWNLRATVDSFARLEDVPLGYWPAIVVEDVQGGAGVHLNKDGQPYALIEAGDSWSVTASHECLEMLADPFGNRLVAGQSPMAGQGRVEFLVEVCDPCADAAFSYRVNNILVSDFYTPRYFDPTVAENVRYSFTGAIREPRQVLKGGYLNWHDPITDHWFQHTYWPEPEIKDLGIVAPNGQSLRARLDAMTPQTKRLSHLPPTTPELRSAIESFSSAHAACAARADSWRAEIDEIRRAAPALDTTSWDFAS